MPAANQDVFNFLASRRSRPAKTLGLPVPDKADLMPILEAAVRTPDHGKLEPWRLIVLNRPALQRLASAIPATGMRLAQPQDKIDKMLKQFGDAHLAVCVVEVQKPSEKIPPLEQTYSAGAVCLALLNAALASGWGANWLSGWASHDAAFCAEHLNLAPNENVAGFIHIGTETSVPPERPRPDLAKITTWVEA